ncbi:MAG: signal peptidase I [Nocardioidaceae bacterium]
MAATEEPTGPAGPSHRDDPDATDPSGGAGPGQPPSTARRAFRATRELVVIVVIALVASALLRAFVVQAFFVPSGSMLPEIRLDDRIVVSRIGDIERGEVVVFQDPGGWIPPSEQAQPPGPLQSALEWVGILPASGHGHLVKRVIGLPGDHVRCCNVAGRLVINGNPVNESSFLFQRDQPADNVSFDVVVPQGHIFVLGDHRYVSYDSSRHLQEGNGEGAFVPESLVTGRAFAVIWPLGHAHLMRIPAAYADVPTGTTPPATGIIHADRPGTRH